MIYSEIPDIQSALARRLYPTVMVWNRLEGRPRTNDFRAAVRAEVRDALWMLARQFQLGEFRAQDAGSVAQVKVCFSVGRMRTLQLDGGAPVTLPTGLPLQTIVEHRPITASLGRSKASLDIRLLLGRVWLKTIAGCGNYERQYIERYEIRLPDPQNPDDETLCAHPEVWQALAAAHRRLMDGLELYLHLTGGEGRHAYDGLNVTEQHKPLLDECGQVFVAWYQRVFLQRQSEGQGAWDPARLEYRFSCSADSAEGGTVLQADEFHGGHLDWYSVDVVKDVHAIDGANGGPQPVPELQTVIQKPVEFDGMPNPRWWAFEDQRTNLDAVVADLTDLAKMMFLSFSLVYSNDWYIVSCTLPVGSLTEVWGIVVTNAFGERLLLRPAGCGEGSPWQQWSMFRPATPHEQQETRRSRLLLLPSAISIQHGAPLEEIELARDESANMVFATETIVPLSTGRGRRGSEAATELTEFRKRVHASAPAGGVSAAAPIRYVVASSIPENRIPFVPVKVSGDVANGFREVQLQRANMPLSSSSTPAGQPASVQPRTSLLAGPISPYFIHEEEVPRDGTVLAQAFHRTRCPDGRVVVWVGIRRRIGHGETSSGLTFDAIVQVPPDRVAASE